MAVAGYRHVAAFVATCAITVTVITLRKRQPRKIPVATEPEREAQQQQRQQQPPAAGKGARQRKKAPPRPDATNTVIADFKPPVTPIVERLPQDVPLVPSQYLSVIVTTSPVMSHPSADLLEWVFRSFDLVPGLQECQKIIVCDGYRVGDTNRRKKGRVTADLEQAYKQHKDVLRQLAASDNPCFRGALIVDLPAHHGFGWAVREALNHVKTPLVMVVQHDRRFCQTFDLQALLRVMLTTPKIQYVCMPNSSNFTHGQTVVARYHLFPEVLEFPGNVKLLPLLFWYDSTHIATVDHYLRLVFRSWTVRRGDFIEDTFGHVQLTDIKQHGLDAHDKYGTYLLSGCAEPIVNHIDGGTFMTAEQRLARGFPPFDPNTHDTNDDEQVNNGE